MPRRPRPRAETSQETRDALIAAGMAAIASDGLDAPSLDSICARAGYTRGAFYVHFKDRGDFIAAVMDGLTAGFMETMFGAADRPADLAEIVTRFAQAVASGKYPLPGAVRLHHVLDACSRDGDVRARRAALYRRAMDNLGAAVRDGQEKGLVRHDVDAGQVGTLLLSVVLGIEVLTELHVPFGTMGAAATILDLVRPQPETPAAPAARSPRRGRR